MTKYKSTNEPLESWPIELRHQRERSFKRTEEYVTKLLKLVTRLEKRNRWAAADLAAIKEMLQEKL